MITGEEIADLIEGQDEIPHDHFQSIEVSRCDPPMPCGSRFFIQFNGFYTLGFDREDLLLFQKEINAGIDRALANLPASPTSEAGAVCVTCGREVTAENGFATVIGSMHFDCEKEG